MSHRRHEDDFAETASAILFQVQKAAVSCLRQKDEPGRTLQELTVRTAAQLVKAASRNLEPHEASEAILRPLLATVKASCAETERAQRRIERAWAHMRKLAVKRDKAQWDKLAHARDYSSAMKLAAQNGWLIAALLSLGLVAFSAKKEKSARDAEVNLVIQNIFRETQAELEHLDHASTQRHKRRQQYAEPGWLRRNARSLKAISPTLLLLTLPALAKRFLKTRQPGINPRVDPEQALYKYSEVRQHPSEAF